MIAATKFDIVLSIHYSIYYFFKFPLYNLYPYNAAEMQDFVSSVKCQIIIRYYYRHVNMILFYMYDRTMFCSIHINECCHYY
jgi:hypothetical protein